MNPGQTFERNGYSFLSLNTGQEFAVRINGQDHTRIARLASIQDNGNSHLIICDPCLSKHPYKSKRPLDREVLRQDPKPVEKVSERVDFSRNFLQEECDYSYMRVYSSDAYKKLLCYEKYGKIRRSNPFVLRFLNGDDRRLVLVYSCTSEDVKQAGEELRRMRGGNWGLIFILKGFF